ncbi:MAG: PQQ-binding-like beta-propeller repeat protein [Bythopirellula sp.]|nr:PQQ-binding-like beta-propeller repeat protein [Bythopirellula sp.]
MWKQIFSGVLFCLVACPAFADEADTNWPGFRGPEFTGVSPEANPPTTWSETVNVKWKVELPGRGSGSPMVWGDRIYLQTAIKTDRTADTPPGTAARETSHAFHLIGNDRYALLAQVDAAPPAETTPPAAGPPEGEGRGERRRGRRGGGRGFGGGDEAPTNFYQFVVMCLDRKTGKTIWQQTAAEAIPHEGHHGTASFASSTPITDGNNIYVSFGSRGVYSYDMDGNLRWKKDLGLMQIRNMFGEGSSPALHSDTLVINWDHEGQSFITALDANTGETKWKVDRDEETTWLTPLIVEYDCKMQVVVNGMNRARGYDLANGEIIWECGGQAMGAVPTAVRYKDLVYCMTGHRGSALYAIPLSAKGDITDTDQVAWKLDQDTPYVPSPLLYDDQLYFTKSNNGILSCYTAQTGEQIFKAQRIPGIDMLYASPVGADGRIYIAGRNGATVVIKHGPEFEVLATNQLDEPIDATPALVGKEIIIRGEKSLYCISE